MTDRERPLRLVVFSPSLIADIDNPRATSTRALLGALAAAGHDVTHLEQRGNALLDRQLRSRGSGALRSLNTRYPEVRARQYDLPRGRQRTVWFGTEVSTADVVVALPGTSPEVLALIAPFETPHLVRVVPPGAVGDIEVDRIGSLVVVERRGRLVEATGLLVVAYDSIVRTAIVAIPSQVERVVIGAAELPGWAYLPEVEVAERYRSTGTVVVLDDDARPESLARVLLPVAAGCRVVAAQRPGILDGVIGVADWDPSSWDVAIRRAADRPVPLLAGADDADTAAATLVAVIRETLTEKRRAFAASLPPQ